MNTVRGDSVKDLVEANIPVFEQFFAQGTTTVEVKSGYGLTVLDEVKQLEAIRELQCTFFDKLTIVPTFLGAHAVPKEFKGNTQKYVDLICSDMIPYVASNKLAKYCDVFCEEGYFDASASLQILQCAKAHGLQVRLHADEFVDSGGASLAARLHAHSADHLMAVSEQGMSDLATAGVVATVLPGTTVFLGKVRLACALWYFGYLSPPPPANSAYSLHPGPWIRSHAQDDHRGVPSRHRNGLQPRLVGVPVHAADDAAGHVQRRPHGGREHARRHLQCRKITGPGKQSWYEEGMEKYYCYCTLKNFLLTPIFVQELSSLELMQTS